MPRFLQQLAFSISIGIALIAQHCQALAAPTVALSFGRNDEGQTGLGTTSGNTLIATPIDASNLGDMRITQVDAGALHSLLLTEDGSVFSFGSNEFGQIGLGTFGSNVSIPTPINTTDLGGRTIAQIAAGAFHNLLLGDDGTVFSFGLNTQGSLGQGTGDGTIRRNARPIDTTNLGGRTIRQVAAGEAHSLLLADDGTVFSFGWNSNGRTGLGIDNFMTGTLIPTPIDTTNLAGKTIIQVAAGGSHSLLLADDGTVFSFGWNASGLTGTGTGSGSTLIATPIDTTNLAGKRITQIAAGRFSNLLLADDGSVFSFGNNRDGQTGLGTRDGETFTATPIDTTNLMGKEIVDLAVGDRYSLLLADDGTVFSFGRSEYGITGLGTDVANTFIATPIDTTNLQGLRGIDISAGYGHSLLLTVVPEPTSVILAGALLFGMLFVRQRM